MFSGSYFKLKSKILHIGVRVPYKNVTELNLSGGGLSKFFFENESYFTNYWYFEKHFVKKVVVSSPKTSFLGTIFFGQYGGRVKKRG